MCVRTFFPWKSGLGLFVTHGPKGSEWVQCSHCLVTRFSGFQSVILPVHNAEPWLDECLASVLQQDFAGSMELSVFNDASKVLVSFPMTPPCKSGWAALRGVS